MAFVDNVANFFLHRTDGSLGVRVFNYIDSPDYNINALVTLARHELRSKPSVGLRLTLSLGLAWRHLADAVSKLTGRNLPISWIRVKKFDITTSFATCQMQVHGFQPRATLEEGPRITLDARFKNLDPNRAVFLTE